MDITSVLAGLYSEDGRRDPYPHYADLHRLGPVSALPPRPLEGVPVAIACGYEVVDQVLRDPEWFKNTLPSEGEHQILNTFETSMMFTNPPTHGRMRQVFARAFTPRRLDALEPVVVRVTEQLLDRMADLGAGGASFDYVAEFAYPLPALVMAEFIGIPETDLDWYRVRVKQIDDFLDISGKTPELIRAADDAASELRGYYTDLIAHRRRSPGDDLISNLVAAVDAGTAGITEQELVSNLIVLFNASFVTTIYLLGSGLPLLLDQPDVVAKLPGDPDLALDCCHEILRCESPVQFLTRQAPRDTELAGVPVGRDQVVLLMVGAANRDPAVFADPDRFDPTRQGPPSLAFGAGAHFCLGAAVSRIEGRIALPRLFARFPGLAVAGPPVYTGNLFLRGVDVLPVTTG
ncbi:cytochrome P450 [Micromonospora echinofusca]|uniref:Cytochrome P450 n=1 Tax=Micromonospora echinofusca TaxID=47858 RepID=A0ABS3VX03_MICEH|nr:cytochrome P450 [Micromonospora echinofusca]MBO4209033.1 cytochrome P450 [Micromonospora echinofusca]